MNWRTRIYLLLMSLFLIAGCRADLYDLPLPSEITKAHREAIGNYITDLVLDDAINFPMLKRTEGNTAAFLLIQGLYNQVTNEMRLDYKSPDSNRWSDRQWKIRILDLDIQMAFGLPGGDIYLSKGLLKALESESELYYLLSTEAILMSEKYLLTELIKAYSTKTLVEIAEGESITDPRIDGIHFSLPQIKYGLDVAGDIKSQVTDLICRSSVFNPLTGEILESRLSTASQWISTRPVGANRDSYDACGNIDGKGLYKSAVLDRL